MAEKNKETIPFTLYHWLVFITGSLLFLLVVNHVPYVNGPAYWQWQWQRLPTLKVYVGMLVAAIPFFAGQLIFYRRRSLLILSIFLVTISSITMQLNGILMNSEGLQIDRIWKIVEHPSVTSYYTDAARISEVLPQVKQWLSVFPKILPKFNLHSLTKPPGLILFYFILIKLFGIGHTTALIGGFLVILISGFVIPAVYWMLRCFGESREVGFLGASFMALCPGFVLFSPEFDQVYPIFTALSLSFWVLALQKDSLLFAICFGAILTLMSFLAYNMLVIGVFVVFYGVYFCLIKNKGKLWLLTKHAIVALFTIFIFYVIFWFSTKFDPIGTFLVSLKNQKQLVTLIPRPYPMTIPFDLLDFTLGLGWISALLIFGYFFSSPEAKSFESRPFVIIGLLQIFIVAGSGLLPGETARVWIFLMPLMMLPVGIELSRWGLFQRNLFYFLSILLVSAIGQNMEFIGGIS